MPDVNGVAACSAIVRGRDGLAMTYQRVHVGAGRSRLEGKSGARSLSVSKWYGTRHGLFWKAGDFTVGRCQRAMFTAAAEQPLVIGVER